MNSLTLCATIKLVNDYSTNNIKANVYEKIAYMSSFIPQIKNLLENLYDYTEEALNTEYYKRYSEFMKSESIKCAEYVKDIKKKEIKAFPGGTEKEKTKYINNIVKKYMDDFQVEKEIELLKVNAKAHILKRRKSAITPIKAVDITRKYPKQIDENYIKPKYVLPKLNFDNFNI